MRVHPGENFLVGAAGQRARRQFGMRQTEEPARAGVEYQRVAVADIGRVFRGQLARREQADLVEHAAEVHQPANLLIRGT